MRFLAGLIIAILVSCGPAMAQTTLSTGNAKKLQGRSVSSTAPTDEQCLIYDTGTSQWRPSNCAASGALTLTGMTGNVSPAVCGRAYIATACGFTLTLPAVPAADCQIGIGVSCVGGTTVVPGGADTISGGTTEPTIQISRNQVQVFQYAATGATWIQHAAPGVMVYEATGTYAMGDVVTDDGTTPTKYCRSRVNANTGNALTSTTHWACFASPDGTTLEFNSGVVQIKDAGVTRAKIGSYFKAEDDDGNCSGTGGSALNLDLTTNAHKFFTITANCEITVTDPTSTAAEVQGVSFCWEQGGAGGFTFANPANVKWAGGTDPTWGTTAGDDNCAFCLYRQSDDEYVCVGIADYAN